MIRLTGKVERIEECECCYCQGHVESCVIDLVCSSQSLHEIESALRRRRNEHPYYLLTSDDILDSIEDGDVIITELPADQVLRYLGQPELPMNMEK